MIFKKKKLVLDENLDFSMGKRQDEKQSREFETKQGLVSS